MVERDITLVYGGAKSGLMGKVADTALEAGGQVIGVITQHLLNQKMVHKGLTKLVIASSMQKRKEQMAALSDAFIALPGGLGTLEELFEVWNGAKINLHTKPLGLLNSKGYFDNLILFIEHIVREGFLSPHQKKLITITDNPLKLLLNLLKD